MTRRWLPFAAVVALLGAAMLAATFANPTIGRLSVQPRGGTGGRHGEADSTVRATATATATAIASQPPIDDPAAQPWVGWLATALCAAAVLTVIGLMIWYYLRGRLPRQPASVIGGTAPLPTITQTRRRLRDAVEAGLAELDDDGDPRRAVIACWVRLEEAAAAAGTPREPGDTSTDLVARLLRSHDVDADLLAGFADVYRQARFAPHAVDGAMRDQARAALGHLRQELAMRTDPAHEASPAAGTALPASAGPAGSASP